MRCYGCMLIKAVPYTFLGRCVPPVLWIVPAPSAAPDTTQPVHACKPPHPALHDPAAAFSPPRPTKIASCKHLFLAPTAVEVARVWGGGSSLSCVCPVLSTSKQDGFYKGLVDCTTSGQGKRQHVNVSSCLPFERKAG